MKFPPATRKDHEKFCETEGWTRRTSARGDSNTHHHSYEFALPSGDILWTRISHPVNRTDYGTSMWASILRDQLQVDQPTFWACVRRGDLPDRGGPPKPQGSIIPLGVVRTLIGFGLPETEVMAMSKDEAIARMAQFYTEQSST